jgi:hypothetical protein
MSSIWGFDTLLSFLMALMTFTSPLLFLSAFRKESLTYFFLIRECPIEKLIKMTQRQDAGWHDLESEQELSSGRINSDGVAASAAGPP